MRLIDADALKKKTYPFPCAIGVEHAVTLRAINEAPAVEAQPARYARWKGAGMGDYMCSLCDEIISGQTNYCPHCGAKMDGEDNHVE